jgi:hypothetical protein
MSERPGRDRPRRLADWLNPTGEKKVHSLVDKVYKRKNLELAWLRVRSERGPFLRYARRGTPCPACPACPWTRSPRGGAAHCSWPAPRAPRGGGRRDPARPHGAAGLPRAQGESACARTVLPSGRCSVASPTGPPPGCSDGGERPSEPSPWPFWQAARPRSRSDATMRRRGWERLPTLRASFPPSTSRFGRASDRAELIGSTKRTTSLSSCPIIQQIYIIPSETKKVGAIQ